MSGDSDSVMHVTQSAIHQDAKKANAYGTQIVSFKFAFRFNQD